MKVSKFNYPISVRFRCIRCGICCGDTKDKSRHILLLKNEVEQIAKATGRQIFNFAAKIEDNAPYSYKMKKRKNGKCVFLENNRCTIYSSRPLICRFYPFELKAMNNRKYTFLYTNECPGINKGQVLNEGYYRLMFLLAHDKFRSPANSNEES
jgi:Fe-S-cluster containining protein